MAAERIIGVDFGTSTSVIRVKRYQDGKPVGDRLEVKPVKFNSGTSEIVPTLIQKLPSGGAYFGHEAAAQRRNTEMFQNFKVDIENPDEGIRRQARELTAEFFQYLAEKYCEQSEGGHLGEIDDRQRTIISYPVKWSDEARDFLVQTAKDVGFPNVEGIDEAQAAIQAVTVQNANPLTRKGYFQDGVPVNILLIDMGAGTTDLVLCRHTPGALPKTDTFGTWPKGGDALFGGREVDELLKSYICRIIPEADAERVRKSGGIEHYKAWKESSVSPALEKKETVDFFSFLNLLGVDAEFSISRDSFETCATDYLRQFPKLVNSCVSAAGLSGDDVDLVILTGGHSQWYFVREMLSGKLNRFGEIALGKIQADPERIIPITLPQETVALGLAYMPLKAEMPPKPQPVEDDNALPSTIVANEVTEVAKPVLENVFPLKYDPYSRIRPVISTGWSHTVGVKEDGTVVAIGKNDDGKCDVYSWRDIVAVAAGREHTVGLRKDGTVISAGPDYEGRCSVNNWRDIVAIAANDNHTVGLKKDGTVIATGSYDKGRCNVNNWRDIVAIAAGHWHTVGLKKDGTVVAVGWNKNGQCNVSNWWDIVAIAAGYEHTVGLKKDGTVVAVGNKGDYQYGVNNWRDIVAIAAVGEHTVGLKKDGTVVASGGIDECDVNRWRDIMAIAAANGETVGLKKDGTVIIVGRYFSFGQTNDGKYITYTEKSWFGLSSKTTIIKQTPWKLF